LLEELELELEELQGQFRHELFWLEQDETLNEQHVRVDSQGFSGAQRQKRQHARLLQIFSALQRE